MSVMDETYRLRTYVDACTDREMLLTSNPPKHRVTCTDVDIKPLIDAIESAYTDDVMAAENRGYESGRNEGVVKGNCMKLPLDADGKPITCDSKVISSSGKVPNVPLCVVGVNHAQVFVTYEDEEGWVHETRVFADTCRRYQPHTVEDVLWELLGSIRPEMEDDEAVPIVRGFAERLQLRGEDDDRA